MNHTNQMTGGEALVLMLQAHGAGPMFGMGGFQLLPFYDAARRLGLDHHLIKTFSSPRETLPAQPPA